MSTTSAGPWISGEEYNSERRRLLRSGHDPEGPEYQSLLTRVTQRNDYIRATLGLSLMEAHPGQWAAITASGDFVLADEQLEVLRLAQARFGAGNSCIARLTPDRGTHRLGPRPRR